MVDVYTAPYGTYTHVQAIAAPLDTELQANLQSLATLLGGTLVPATHTFTTVGTAGHPDFNKIDHVSRVKILQELAWIAYHVTLG